MLSVFSIQEELDKRFQESRRMQLAITSLAPAGACHRAGQKARPVGPTCIDETSVYFRGSWIASWSLSSGAHSRDPLARNDGRGQRKTSPRHCEALLRRSNPVFLRKNARKKLLSINASAICFLRARAVHFEGTSRKSLPDLP
jgi:hypothetical protein